MTKVTLHIHNDKTDQELVYHLSGKKAKYLIKFIDALNSDSDTESPIYKDIEKGLNEVKDILTGRLEGLPLHELLNHD
ncbi:MAG TPA: hypothetical protein PK715_13370 [Chitinophagales bacterium]|nr:hypothetical protein [Chitinophagales bacterium]